jgi:hypothetical protein
MHFEKAAPDRFVAECVVTESATTFCEEHFGVGADVTVKPPTQLKGVTFRRGLIGICQ